MPSDPQIPRIPYGRALSDFMEALAELGVAREKTRDTSMQDYQRALLRKMEQERADTEQYEKSTSPTGVPISELASLFPQYLNSATQATRSGADWLLGTPGGSALYETFADALSRSHLPPEPRQGDSRLPPEPLDSTAPGYSAPAAAAPSPMLPPTQRLTSQQPDIRVNGVTMGSGPASDAAITALGSAAASGDRDQQLRDIFASRSNADAAERRARSAAQEASFVPLGSNIFRSLVGSQLNAFNNYGSNLDALYNSPSGPYGQWQAAAAAIAPAKAAERVAEIEAETARERNRASSKVANRLVDSLFSGGAGAGTGIGAGIVPPVNQVTTDYGAGVSLTPRLRRNNLRRWLVRRGNPAPVGSEE